MRNGLIITGIPQGRQDPAWAGMGGGAWAEMRTAWSQDWPRWSAAVSEGLCPEHGSPLEPVPSPPRKIAGRCAECHRYWGLNIEDEQAGWWLDHNPVTGWPAVRVPDFMAWREEP
jgi:hypothetical protein